MMGKNVAQLETIMMTKRAEMRAPSWPLYSFWEAARAQMTSLGSAVVRSTALALKPGVPNSSLEDISVAGMGAVEMTLVWSLAGSEMSRM